MGVFLKELGKASFSARIGVAVIVLIVLAAIFAPWVAPYGQAEVVGDVWQGSSGATWLGTDQLGRDLLSRMLYGARNTVSIALLTTIFAFTIGIVVGFFAAVMGGWVDMLVSRIVDIVMAFPTLIFALMVLSVLGTSIPVLIVTIAVLYSTPVYRLARALAMDVNAMDFVEVARLRGERLWWIMIKEILPNTVAPLSAEFGMRFCFVFLLISALSFLGLGIQPPLADWGAMVRENAQGIAFGIFTPLIPAAAIAVLTIGVNMVVDWFLQKTAGEHIE